MLVLPSLLEVLFCDEKHLIRGRWKGRRTAEMLNETSGYCQELQMLVALAFYALLPQEFPKSNRSFVLSVHMIELLKYFDM
jgi:hypothetical protein